MNLLRYYLMVGGAGLDVDAYSAACKEIGIKTGKVGYIKNPKINNSSGMSALIESGVPGTFGDGYSIWQSEIVDYEADEGDFLRKFYMTMSSEYSQLWMNEEQEMINFLLPFKNKMPSVSNYCDGDFFVILKVVYACTDEGGNVCPGYSNRIINILAEIGAGIEPDCEPYSIHFSRIRELKRLGGAIS